MSKFEQLKQEHEDKIIDITTLEEINESEAVKEVQDNGYSGQYPELKWYTVVGKDEEEFDVYC